MILLSDLNETQCFNACDEFPIGCNPHKNQTLSCMGVMDTNIGHGHMMNGIHSHGFFIHDFVVHS